ncbi:hypothetical protein [Geminicoccus harenae]|uniref:hypothetical protein n=1 Tax=Geminicoccus harenae TaxID=2498453 RepID=UPI00168AA5BC|nr:hypothetical protein [Geminicoccus harenae]
MAMSRSSWSINALSVEFGLDRRTVGKRLENVTPYDLGADGSPRWRLSDAAPALLLHATKAPAKAPQQAPEGCEILERIPNPVHSGFVVAWMELFANFQPIAAGALMGCGLSRTQAERAVGWLLVGFIGFANDAARKANIPPWIEEEDPAWLPADMMLKPDWNGLAAHAKQVRSPG